MNALIQLRKINAEIVFAYKLAKVEIRGIAQIECLPSFSSEYPNSPSLRSTCSHPTFPLWRGIAPTGVKIAVPGIINSILSWGPVNFSPSDYFNVVLFSSNKEDYQFGNYRDSMQRLERNQTSWCDQAGNDIRSCCRRAAGFACTKGGMCPRQMKWIDTTFSGLFTATGECVSKAGSSWIKEHLPSQQGWLQACCNDRKQLDSMQDETLALPHSKRMSGESWSKPPSTPKL